MIIGSPLEQFVINLLISISMIGVDLSITNSSLTMIIAIVLIITTYKLSIERGYIVPTRIQSVFGILVIGKHKCKEYHEKVFNFRIGLPVNGQRTNAAKRRIILWTVF